MLCLGVLPGVNVEVGVLQFVGGLRDYTTGLYVLCQFLQLLLLREHGLVLHVLVVLVLVVYRRVLDRHQKVTALEVREGSGPQIPSSSLAFCWWVALWHLALRHALRLLLTWRLLFGSLLSEWLYILEFDPVGIGILLSYLGLQFLRHPPVYLMYIVL